MFSKTTYMSFMVLTVRHICRILQMSLDSSRTLWAACMNALYIHFDLDCFFAAVEMLHHPELRGVPVCVGGLRGQRGIVACPNYEARAYGVRTAMPIRTAERMLPSTAVFVRGRHTLYGEYSQRVMAVFGGFTPDVWPKSIDEALLEVSGCLHLWGHDPGRMARAIKDRVKADTGLTVSAGVAPNPLCAKIAAGLRKPDGLVVVPRGGVREFLTMLSIDDVPGIGKKTAPGLKLRNIKTVGDLMARPPAQGTWMAHLLESLLDEHGMYAGGDHEPADHSISRDRTFWEDTDDRARIDAMLFGLVEKCCRTLRSESLAASTVTMKVRFSNFTTLQKQMTLPSASTNEEDILAAARTLLSVLLPEGRFIRLVGVKVSNLSPMEGQQLMLDAGRSEKLHALHTKIDKLRERYGDESIKWVTVVESGNEQEVDSMKQEESGRSLTGVR